MKRLLGAALALLIVGALAHDAEGRGRGRRLFWRAPASADTLPLVLTDPTLSNALTLYVPLNYTRHMWTQALDGVALTHPTTDGALIGQVDDSSYGDGNHPSHLIQWGSAARAGVYRIDATTGYAYAELRAAGGNDIAYVQDSQAAFRYCHGPGAGPRACTVIMCVGVPTDAAAYTLLDSARGTQSNVGLTVLRTAANRVQVFTPAGATNSCSHTTAVASLTAASGLTTVGWRVSGNAVQINVGATEENFTCANGGSPAPSTDELTIGGSSAGTGSSNLNLGGVMVFRGSLSDADYAAAAATVCGRPSTRSLQVDLPLAQGGSNFLRRFWDYTNASALNTDATCTATVARFGDQVRCVEDARDRHNSFRGAATSTAAGAPIWARHDGLFWRRTSAQRLVQPVGADGGAQTVIAAARTDGVGGLSTLFAGAAYVPVTDYDYSVNCSAYGWCGYLLPSGQIAGRYWAVHTAIIQAPGATPLLYPDDWNWVEIRRDGATWDTSSSGYRIPRQVHSSTVTNAGIWRRSSTGADGPGPGTGMRGHLRAQLEYAVVLSDDRIAAIREYFTPRAGVWSTVGRWGPSLTGQAWATTQAALSAFGSSSALYPGAAALDYTNLSTSRIRRTTVQSTGGISFATGFGGDLTNAGTHEFTFAAGFEIHLQVMGLASGLASAQHFGGILLATTVGDYPFPDSATINDTVLIGQTSATNPTPATDIDVISMVGGVQTRQRLANVRTDDRLMITLYAPPGGGRLDVRVYNPQTGVTTGTSLNGGLPTVALGLLALVNTGPDANPASFTLGPAVWGRGAPDGVALPTMPPAFPGAGYEPWMAAITDGRWKAMIVEQLTAPASPWDFGAGPNNADGITGRYGSLSSPVTGVGYWNLAPTTTNVTDPTYGQHIRLTSGTTAITPAGFVTNIPNDLTANAKPLARGEGFFVDILTRHSCGLRGVIGAVGAGLFGDPATEVSTFPGIGYVYDVTDGGNIYWQHGAVGSPLNRTLVAPCNPAGVYRTFIGARPGTLEMCSTLYDYTSATVLHQACTATNVPGLTTTLNAETNASPCSPTTGPNNNGTGCTPTTNDTWWLRGRVRGIQRPTR